MSNIPEHAAEKASVLLVEDDPSTGRMIKLTLGYEAPQFHIELMGGAEECLEYLASNDADCILSDYQMRGMDGMELLRRLRESGIDVPFIFLTGQGNEEVAREAFKNGAYDYFTKEAGFAHFPRIINSIEQAVRQRSAERHRKRAERELSHEKHKLETILSSIADGISIQDREFRILYQNRAHIGLAGSHAGGLCYEQYAKGETICTGCPVEACFADGGTYRLEKSFLRDGRKIHIEISASPLRDAEGNIIAGIEAVRDVTERKEQEAAQREGEAFLETVIEAVPECVKLLSSEGRLIRMNRAGLDMIQADSLEQVMGHTVEDLVVPEHREAFREAAEKVFSGHGARLEFDMVGLKGRLLRLETLAVPLWDDEGGISALLGVTRDVTEQKKAKEALEHRLTLEKAVAYASSVLAAGEGVDLTAVLGILGEAVNADRAYIFRFRDDARYMDNTHEWCSPGTRPEIENLQGMETVSAPWFLEHMLSGRNFIVPDVSAMPAEAAPERAIFEEQDIRSIAIVPMYSAGELYGFVGFDDTKGARDWSEDDIRLLRAASGIFAAYTGRIIAAAALRRSEEGLREAQRIAHVGSWTLDLKENSLSWSDEIYRISEMDPDRFGASYEAFLDLVHPDDREHVDRAYRDSVRDRTPYDLIHRLLMKDGRVKYVHERCETHYGDDGAPLRSIGTVHDITEMKRLESIAESVNLMNNLGYVFAGVRHEIGGPVNAVKMTLGLLKDNIDEYPREKRSDYLSRCMEEIERVEYLLHSLRNYNMYETPRLSSITAGAFMEKFLSLARPDFTRSGIGLSVVDEGGAGMRMMVDPRALQQVMLNVVSNAMDALAGMDEPEVRIGLSGDGGMVVMTVRDNGCGMSGEQAQNLFKPFYTSKPGGTGLGLVIARRMLSKMGATIDVSGRPAEGTTVKIAIPEERVENA